MLQIMEYYFKLSQKKNNLNILEHERTTYVNFYTSPFYHNRGIVLRV